MFNCPVCYYDKMPDAPNDYNICPCCGIEFENDDERMSHSELRDRWITSGAYWFLAVRQRGGTIESNFIRPPRAQPREYSG
jgi:hypothetical protein